LSSIDFITKTNGGKTVTIQIVVGMLPNTTRGYHQFIMLAKGCHIWASAPCAPFGLWSCISNNNNNNNDDHYT